MKDKKICSVIASLKASLLYLLSGTFLIVVSGLFTDIILRAYSNDSKMGPTHSIGMVQHDENLVRYEFGACLCKSNSLFLSDMTFKNVNVEAFPPLVCQTESYL